MLFDFLRGKNKVIKDVTPTNPSSEGQNDVNVELYAPGGEGEMVIEDVFSITGRGTVVTGRVKGHFHINQSVVIEREGRETLPSAITGIESFRKMLDNANDGDNCGLLLREVQRDEVSRGDVVKSV